MSSPALGRLLTIREQLSVGQQARLDALEAISEWYGDPAGSIAGTQRAFSRLLNSDDPSTLRIGVFLAEMATVEEIWQPIRDLNRELSSLASQDKTVRGAEDQESLVRLLICLAEANGELSDLAGRARENFQSRNAALIWARYARLLAWQARPQDALEAYGQAAQLAADAELWGEVSEVLRSQSTLRARYFTLDETFQENLLLTRTMADRGSSRYLKRDHDPRAAALQALERDSKPQAYRELRRYLWESRISGHLAAELDAYRLLGDLLANAGEPVAAIGCFLLAGEAKKAKELASQMEVVVDVGVDLGEPTPWRRASALDVVASQSDLIPDQDIEQVVRAALTASTGVPQGPIGPQVHVEAVAAIAALADRLPAELVTEVLDLASGLIDREEGYFRDTDDDVIRILIAVYQTSHNHREDITALLIRSLKGEPAFAFKVARSLSQLVSPSEQLVSLLRAMADQGNEPAILGLTLLGDPHPAVLREARLAAERLLAEKPQLEPRTEWAIGLNRRQTAILSGFLHTRTQGRIAHHLLLLARDESDMEANRAEAITAVGILSQGLSRKVRDELFWPVLSLTGLDVSSLVDDFARQSLHPLSPFRFDLGVGSLPAAALRTAARLARITAHSDAVVNAALRLISSNDAGLTNTAASALHVLLNKFNVDLDERLVALSPNVPLRQVAVRLWARRLVEPEFGERFLRDPAKPVRLVLAYELGRAGRSNPGLAEHLQRELMTDRSATVRRVAAESL